MNIVVGIVLNSIGDSFKKEDVDDVSDRDALAELEKLKRQMEVVEKALGASFANKKERNV